MSETQSDSRNDAAEAPATDKRPWVTPEATVEKVEQATGSNINPGADSINCHS